MNRLSPCHKCHKEQSLSGQAVVPRQRPPWKVSRDARQIPVSVALRSAATDGLWCQWCFQEVRKMTNMEWNVNSVIKPLITQVNKMSWWQIWGKIKIFFFGIAQEMFPVFPSLWNVLFCAQSYWYKLWRVVVAHSNTYRYSLEDITVYKYQHQAHVWEAETSKSL